MSAEVIEALMVRPDGWYVDCTFGRGGHSRAIMAQLGAAGRCIYEQRFTWEAAWTQLARENFLMP